MQRWTFIVLCLAACERPPRDIATVNARIDAPTGIVDAQTAPTFVRASRDARLIDASAAVIPYLLPPGTMNLALAERQPSPFECVESLVAASLERLDVAGSCLDPAEGDGHMSLALTRANGLVSDVGLDYVGLRAHGTTLEGGMRVSATTEGYAQIVTASIRALALGGGGDVHIEAGFRSKIVADQLLWDWTVFLGTADDAPNVVLSTRADVGAGELVATASNGVWDCSWRDGGASGACQPRCTDPEIIANTCCTCRLDEIAENKCDTVCPVSTSRRPAIW